MAIWHRACINYYHCKTETKTIIKGEEMANFSKAEILEAIKEDLNILMDHEEIDFNQDNKKVILSEIANTVRRIVASELSLERDYLESINENIKFN